MEVRIDTDTLKRTEERGTNRSEIDDIVNADFTIPGKHGRKGRAKIYPF